MAKTKTPFLSMGAKGTIGGVLTAQKRGGDTILRSTPVPTDPYSLAQAYQRWDYRDYAYLWTLLSEATKQTYRTRASRYHITGFSLWMRENLKALTNLTGRWHLDERSGAVAYDSSKNANNGVIVGATPATGIIDGCYSFDSINDYIAIPHHSSLAPTEECSLAAFVKPVSLPTGAGQYTYVFEKHADRIDLYFPEAPNPAGYFICAGGAFRITSPDPIPLAVWSHLRLTYHHTDGANLYVNGVLKQTAAGKGLILPITNPWYIGAYGTGANCFDGLIDEVSLDLCVRDITETKRQAERSYP